MSNKSIVLAIPILVLSITSFNATAALITQSFSTSVGETLTAYTDTIGTDSTANYFYATVPGFDLSLGDLVSVNLSLTANNGGTGGLDASYGFILDKVHTSGYSTGNAHFGSSYQFNLNVNAGNYDQSLINETFNSELQSTSSGGIFGSNGYQFHNPTVGQSFNLLDLYDASEFDIPLIGLQEYRSASVDVTSCTGSSGGCTATNTFHNATEVSISYIYEDGIAAVPVPAAAWLFGSGLLGLIGVARRKA